MPKRVISFKPTPECEQHLADLMDRWKCDRTAAIIRAIDEAARGRSEMAIVDSPSLSPSGLTRGATVRLSKEPKRTVVARVDRDKIAAFQRKAGMGGAGKR